MILYGIITYDIIRDRNMILNGIITDTIRDRNMILYGIVA